MSERISSTERPWPENGPQSTTRFRARVNFERRVPAYLQEHFWWAYLWPRTLRFFDHPTIISAILFGHYRRLMRATLARVAAWPVTHTSGGETCPGQRMLQLTCVYGDLTPSLQAALAPRALHITDIVPQQLHLARGKSPDNRSLQATRMNAEQLGYRDDSFSAALIFFLLHELPVTARRQVLRECLRTLQPGARLLITEYAQRPPGHWFSRVPLLRKILLRAEPFLGDFWEEDLHGLLEELANTQHKTVRKCHEEHHFKGFYRIMEYRIGRSKEG